MKKLWFLASLVLAGCNAPKTATLVVKADPNTEVLFWGAGKDEIHSFEMGVKDTTNAEGYMTYQVELTESKVDRDKRHDDAFWQQLGLQPMSASSG